MADHRDQILLMDFLQADLDLATTFLQTAKIATEPEHLRKIRELLVKVDDPASRKSIVDQAAELEAALGRAENEV